MHRRLSRVARDRGVAGLGRLFGVPNRREQIVPVTITRAQRDAIYELVVNHLTGIGDVWSRSIAASSRRPSAWAARLPRTCGCWRTSAGPTPSTARRWR